jgi:hypothetical protein
MHPDWARSLRDQCAAAGVPFLFKQWGTRPDHPPPRQALPPHRRRDRAGRGLTFTDSDIDLLVVTGAYSKLRDANTEQQTRLCLERNARRHSINGDPTPSTGTPEQTGPSAPPISPSSGTTTSEEGTEALQRAQRTLSREGLARCLLPRKDRRLPRLPGLQPPVRPYRRAARPRRHHQLPAAPRRQAGQLRGDPLAPRARRRLHRHAAGSPRHLRPGRRALDLGLSQVGGEAADRQPDRQGARSAASAPSRTASCN